MASKPSEKKESKSKKLTIEQKFYWVRTGVAAITALLGVLAFGLKGWWMLLYLVLFLFGWPFIQSLLIFRLPYKKGEWDWKKILKTGVGAHFFTFMLLTTICFSLITYSDYSARVTNRADTREMIQDGNNIFIADGENGFIILDATDLGNRELVAKYSNNSVIFDGILIDDNFAFLTTENSEIYIFDIQNLQDPVLLKIFPLSVKILDLEAHESSLYIATENGLATVEYSNSIDIEINFTHENIAFQSVKVRNQTIFLVDSQGNLLYANDSNTISNPLIDVSVELPENVIDVELFKNQLYVVSNASELVILNVENITSIEIVDQHDFANTTNDLWVENEEIILLAQDTAGIRIINLTDSENLFEANATLYNTIGDCYNVYIWEENIVVSDGTRGISIIDLNHPISVPELAGSQNKSISFGWNWLLVSGIAMGSIILTYTRRKRV